VEAQAKEKVTFVYLVYADDSSGESTYQIMTAVIVPDASFRLIEQYLATVIDAYVSEDQRDSFEFHASAMFHSKAPFESLSRDKSLEIFQQCTNLVDGSSLRISYGAVDLRKLRSGIYATAHPADISFRLCLSGVEEAFKKQAEERRAEIVSIASEQQFPGALVVSDPQFDDFGILICDKGNAKEKEIQKAFWANRRRLKSAAHTRGELDHLHDDMYFGDSAYSVGIQIADICGFLILRHLEGKADTEHLFKDIEPSICYGEVEPH
jgi:hypothetical protein